MRIIFVNPPICDSNGRYRLNQPIGANILNAILEKKGHQVAYIDAEALDMDTDSAVNALLRTNPDAIGMTLTMRNFPSAVTLIDKIKLKNPKVYIATGGPHASCSSDLVMEKSKADSVTIGEADLNICDIFENKLTGIIQGKMPTDLGSLPTPAWHRALPKPNQYLGNLPRFEQPECCYLWTRGCLFTTKCKMCSHPAFRGKPVRFVPPEKVVEDVSVLLSTYHAKHIFMYADETVGTNKLMNDWLLETCQEIQRKDLKFTWKTQGRPNRFTNKPEIFRAIKSIGCKAIMLGIESFSQKVLTALNKGTTVEDIMVTLENMKAAEIDCFGFFMVGCLEETEEEFQTTLRIAREVKKAGLIRWAQVTVMSAERGSQLWDIANKNGWVVEGFKPQWYHYEASLNMPWATPARINQRRVELSAVLT